MSLLRKVFGDKGREDSREARASRLPASRLPAEDDDDDDDGGPRRPPRREVLHVVLRDTMRRHGIPSDWIDCTVMKASPKSDAVHAVLLVRGGHEALLRYVPAFQASLRAELVRLDPAATRWLAGLSWQFEGVEQLKPQAMPSPSDWGKLAAGSGPALSMPSPLASGPAPLAMPSPLASGPAPLASGPVPLSLPPVVATQPEPAASRGAAATQAVIELPALEYPHAQPSQPPDEEVEDDLRQLYAIRDEVLRKDQPDFEDTLPPDDGSGAGRPAPPAR